MRTGVCWLCEKEAELHNSHVIPRFVFRWLIETGGTPFLRAGANPNRRVQDGDKHYLYCSDCEAALSKWEQRARERIFAPATRNGEIGNNYGPWLSRFACSLALRALQSQMYRGIDNKYDPTSRNLIAAAEKSWKQFLTGSTKHPREFSQYFLHLGYFDSFGDPTLPSNWNTWVKRSVERDTIYTPNGSFLASYVKLGPIIFFGKIRDEKQILGKSFIRCSEGEFPRPNSLLNSTIWNLFKDRASSAQKMMNAMSEKQKQLVDEQILKDPEKFLNSDLAESLLQDFEQFGGS